MRMTGPHGFFVLDPEHAGDLVFGATGTGVAAVMPMLGELSRRTDGGRRYLFWGDVAMNHPDLVKDLPRDLITVAWEYGGRDNFGRYLTPFRDAGIEVMTHHQHV